MTKPSILLVDDEPSILESLARDLEHANYAVSKATDGTEAILMLQKYTYELIITDLIMPQAGGIEVLRNAKRDTPETGVFILTGYGDMSSAIEALRLGADDYLIKPCDPDELLLRIRRYIEKLETLRKIKVYEDILPICMFCKKIKEIKVDAPEVDRWIPVDEFISSKSGTMMSHSCCPSCYEIHKDD